MIAVRGFFGGETKEHGQIRNRARSEFLFVEREEMCQVAARRTSFGERVSGNILQTKLDDGLRQGAGKAGCLSDGREISQLFRRCGGVNNPRGERFDAEAGDRRKPEAPHGLGGEIRRKLRERESMQALATGRKGADGEFVGCGSCWRDD
jgi:hypothetical protein